MIAWIRAYVADRFVPVAWLSVWLVIVWWITASVYALYGGVPSRLEIPSYWDYSGAYVEVLLTIDSVLSNADSVALAVFGVTPVILWFVVTSSGVARAVDTVIGTVLTGWIYVSILGLFDQAFRTVTQTSVSFMPTTVAEAMIDAVLLGAALLWLVAPIVSTLIGLLWYHGIETPARGGAHVDSS